MRKFEFNLLTTAKSRCFESRKKIAQLFVLTKKYTLFVSKYLYSQVCQNRVDTLF
jgi:hypothetical protein